MNNENNTINEEWKVFYVGATGKPSKKEGAKRVTVTFEISTLGNIRKKQSNEDFYREVKKSLSGGHAASGRYECFSINEFKYVHRLVATAFIPNPDNLATVDHIDNDKTNNCVTNLRWMSYNDNIKRKFKNAD